MELKIAFIGFGKVARAFAHLLAQQRSRLATQFNIRWRATAIATANHGSVLGADLDLEQAVDCIESGYMLAGLWRTQDAIDSFRLVENCDADVLFETTPLNPINGEPATTLIRRGLARGMSAVTANKGPLAFAYHELKALAIHYGVSFRFEGTVMDGTPVFNMLEYCLPGTTVTGFYGILNSTSNLILCGMETGRSFPDCLDEAKSLGIVEADEDHDVDGWDASVKAVALANVLMGADARPRDVERTGIRNMRAGDLAAAFNSGLAVRLVARAEMLPRQLVLRVAPETVPVASVLGATRGTSNALVIQTDLMGEVALIETDPGIEQTAYALFSDLIRVHEEMLRGRRPRRRSDRSRV